MIRKNYNLATPELIAKLWKVGAIAHPHIRTTGKRVYRVSVPTNVVEAVNPLLTGTKFNDHATIYSKDVWNALLAYNERRTSYGHSVEVTKPKVRKQADIITCCAEVRSFRFSDGKVISMCPIHSGRTNHCHDVFNSTRLMDVQRRSVLLGGGAR